jgi:hypothetical protein
LLQKKIDVLSEIRLRRNKMRKVYLAIIVAGLAAAVVTGCSRGYESRKTVDDVTVTLSAGYYPLVKGDNTLTVKVTDASGKPVTDAQVSVRFYMPPMPGMAPMEFNPPATLKGNAYTFTSNVPMEGGWKADVSVARPGKAAVTATFNVDAR